MLNRHQRRAGQAVHKKLVKQNLSSGNWGEWEDRVTELVDKHRQNGKTGENIRAFMVNNIYSVQIFASGKGLLMGIRRNDQSTEVSWSHKQRIKNELLGESLTAIEVFPAVDQLVDQANMFWLWSFHETGYNLKEFTL